MLSMSECRVVELGMMEYTQSTALQQRIVAARKAGAIPDVLLLCEHPPVITLGRNGRTENLLATPRVLEQMGVEYHATNRGGDITYHGPGQLVGYPILNLAEIKRDVVWYVRQLEEAMIRATAEYGITARRKSGMTGIWVETGAGQEEKLAAIGVHISRWVTSHGFAYNVATDLRHFDLIVPCGIRDKKPTSLERLLGHAVSMDDVASRVTAHMGEVFGLTMERASRDELETALNIFEEQHATVPAAI